MSENQPVPQSVYEVYEAVEKCAEHYAKAGKVVEPYHRMQPRQENERELIADAPKQARKLLGHLEELKIAMDNAESMVKSIARDIHRASAGYEDWGEAKASSIAEAVVCLCKKVCEPEWSAETLTEDQWHNQRVVLLREQMDEDAIKAKLNLEAARVVDVQERKGPDLARFTDIEKRIYAGVLLHGPIDEKGLNMLLYDNRTKGDLRRYAGPMVQQPRHLLGKVAQGRFRAGARFVCCHGRVEFLLSDQGVSLPGHHSAPVVSRSTTSLTFVAAQSADVTRRSTASAIAVTRSGSLVTEWSLVSRELSDQGLSGGSGSPKSAISTATRNRWPIRVYTRSMYQPFVPPSERGSRCGVGTSRDITLDSEWTRPVGDGLGAGRQCERMRRDAKGVAVRHSC